MSPFQSILVVDNDPTIAALIIEVLSSEGYRVCSASNGLDALVAITLDPPALVLFDMWLPDMSASELIGELHGIGMGHLPLVLMNTSPCAALPLLVPGRITCLSKPFHIDALLTLVARQLAHQPAASATDGRPLRVNRMQP